MSSLNLSAIPFILLLTLFGFASSDINKDKAECTQQLVGLAPCLPYVGGEAKTPTIDCCGGVKDVVQKSMRCLCILVKDRDDPNLGFKINVTLALQLPGACKAPTNLTKCIDLLHLQPSSADAKVFSDFQHNLEHPNTTSPVASAGKADKGKSPDSGGAADVKSSAGNGMRLLKVELISGVLLWFVYVIHAL